MTKKESLKNHWAKEKDRLREMTFREKVDHIWTYYREYLWVVAVAVIVIGATVTSTINLLFKEPVVTGIAVNITLEQAGYNYLTEDYGETLDINPRWDIVKLEYTAFGDLSDPTNSEQNYYAAMTVVGEVEAEMLDYIILDKEGMLFYIEQNIYMDLREFFTAEELAQLAKENRLFYAQQEGSEDKWVVAADITDTPFAQDNITSEGQVYFAISARTQRPEACRDIWEYLNKWQPSGKEPETTTAAN